MKSIIFLPIVLFFLFFEPQKAVAQWGLFGDLFSQLDTTDFNNTANNFGAVDSTWTVDYSLGNDQLHDLYDLIGDSLPMVVLDSSYLFGVNAGLDTLFGTLADFGLGIADQDTILSQADSIAAIFEANFDSLGNLFSLYQDSLDFDSAANWSVVIVNYDSLQNSNLAVLQDTFDTVFDTSSGGSSGGFANLFGKLFDANIFPDLELAFGIQQADLKYWDMAYSEKARMFRVGSVPRFQTNVSDQRDGLIRLPLEARWHLQMSWMGDETGNGTSSLGEAQSGTASASRGFNPLLLDFDLAMMATPHLGNWGNTSFRLITSLGMEFGTYAPAHQDYNPPFTGANRGFATGGGPQVGGGFSMTTGSLVVYSLTTIAHGNLIRSPLPYKYNSRKVEVGMRFGNIINVRYATGQISWQPDDNRRAKITNQVTVGIILDELHF